MDFKGKFAIQPLGFATADLFQRLAGFIERAQAKENGGGIQRKTAYPENQQGEVKIAGESTNIVFQHIAVARHAEPGNMPRLIHFHFSFRHFNIIVVRVFNRVKSLVALVERCLFQG